MELDWLIVMKKLSKKQRAKKNSCKSSWLVSSCDDYLYVGAIIKIVKLKTRIVKQVKLGRRRRKNTAEEDEAKKCRSSETKHIFHEK